MFCWWRSRYSSSWESQNQGQSRDWSKQQWQESHWEANQSSSIQSSAPVLPSTFAPDHLHYDKTPVGNGCHVLHRCVQATEWSRKTGIAGRDVADIRAFELSEGRHQSIVWARSGSESVLLTALLKKIRESGISIDDAAQACHSGAVPDKHKEAMRFMEPLAQELLKCLEAKAPVKSHDVVDELAKAKAKMAEHGITMSPVKRKHDQDSCHSVKV